MVPPPNLFWGVQGRHFEKLDHPSPGRLGLDPLEAHVRPIRVYPLLKQVGAKDRGKKVRLPSSAHDQQSHRQRFQTTRADWRSTVFHIGQGEGQQDGFV